MLPGLAANRRPHLAFIEKFVDCSRLSLAQFLFLSHGRAFVD
jgi:hypothetical protein